MNKIEYNTKYVMHNYGTNDIIIVNSKEINLTNTIYSKHDDTKKFMYLSHSMKYNYDYKKIMMQLINYIMNNKIDEDKNKYNNNLHIYFILNQSLDHFND